MKILNKITLILVAVMGMAISGCGGDIKKAPYVVFEGNDGGYIKIMLLNNLDIPKKESEVIYKKLKVKKITLLGKKECPLQDLSEKSDGITVYMYEVKNRADCPPKDRLKGNSYDITLKTNYGAFIYNIGDESTKIKGNIGGDTWNRGSTITIYKPINIKGGKK